MNRNTEITLDQLHDGIVDTLKAAYPGVHVEAYREDRKGLPVPAILVELTGLDPDGAADPGTDQLAMTAGFEALVVLGFRQEPGKNPKREVRRMAASVAAFTRLQRWGCPIGPAQVLGAWPSDFEPELDQFEVWRVEWEQVIHLGQSVWRADEGTDQPAQVLLGQVPRIGAPYPDEYTDVTR